MSETLLAAFQSQLSNVMETVLKTAMYEVTRLVEDGFLEEVSRRKQEVDLLSLRLEWTERELKDVESRAARCVDCGKTGVSNDEDTHDIHSGAHIGVLGGCNLKQEEEESESRWISCELVTEPLAQEAETTTSSPVKESAMTGDEVKAEANVAQPSCTVVDFQNDMFEPLHQLQQDCEGLWSPTIKHDQQSSPMDAYTDIQTNTHIQETGEEALEIPSSPVLVREPERKQAAHTFRHDDSTSNPNRTGSGSGNNNICDSVRKRGGASPEWTALSRPGDTEIDVLRAAHQLDSDQIFPSLSPETRLTRPDKGSVAIKQEVVIVEDEEEEEEEELGTQSQYRVRPELNVRQNYITQKAPGQQVMKRLGSQARPGTLLHPSHPPIRKHSRMQLTNTGAASSNPAPQVVVASQHRTSNPASKPPVLPLHPPQRAPPADKRLGLPAPNRTSNNPWVNIKTHHLNLQGGSQPHQHPHPGKAPLKTFPHPKNLQLQTQGGDRPFSCFMCGRSFTKLCNLKAHHRVHTGERPYCCQACGKRFTQKSHLKVHQRTHTGERPYCCSICGLSFMHLDQLKSHKRKHGPDLQS